MASVQPFQDCVSHPPEKVIDSFTVSIIHGEAESVAGPCWTSLVKNSYWDRRTA